MKFTRRNFIQSSTVAAFAAALGFAAGGRDSGFLTVSAQSGAETLNYLTREHFEPFINTAIRIRSEKGRTSTIWLREAADLKEQINVDRGYAGDTYRLSFEAPHKAGLTQGTYEFDHEKLGQFSLFLAPVGQSAGHLEAIINRVC